jgi:hypothetical protein
MTSTSHPTSINSSIERREQRERTQTLKLQVPGAVADRITASASRLGVSRNQYLVNLIQTNEPAVIPPRLG